MTSVISLTPPSPVQGMWTEGLLAGALSALAALVDLKLAPQRLTPGFEQLLRRPSLTLVYVGFGAGLALGGLLQLRQP